MRRTEPLAPRAGTEQETVDASFAKAAVALTPGVRVGEYAIGEVIASGGFGVVYRAEHAEHRTSAALKVLHAELAGAPEAIRRFEREIEAIRRIRHPNVIDVQGFGQLDDGRPYFVMELLNGVDLEAHVRASGCLSSGEALAIIEPLCAALGEAHDKAIIHRDFKASNVFLSERDGARRVVLLDFGVAKLLDEAGPGLTTSRTMLGTPACMAPEQITGRATDARTDVYALGALAYYMLTGELPFRDESVAVMLHMHLYARPPSPSAVAPVSSAFDEVVARAMSKDPSERHASMDAFLSGFRAAVEASHGPAGAARPSGEVRDRRALGVYLEVMADAYDPDAPDEQLLADMEAVLPRAARLLGERGLAAVMERGNTMLLAVEVPSDPAFAEARRRDAVLAALEIFRELGRREGKDARVHVNICLHEGIVELADGAVVGGELVGLASWVPKVATRGVVGSPRTFTGLGFATEPVEGASELLRVLDEEPRPESD